MIRHPQLADLDPAAHASHPLHAAGAQWRETNCYVDVWIELLHALGLEVPACLAFTVAADDEGDQWTFFKPPHADLADLYGIAIEELMLWRSMVDHAATQVARGSIPLVEVDSFHLPDTHGTDYRKRHVKTTIAIASIDPSGRRLGYFHNTGFHALEGEDFDGVFRLQLPRPEGELPPYCEIAKIGSIVRREPEALRAIAKQKLSQHLARRPKENPIRRYAARIDEHQADLVRGDLEAYHAYVFAWLRQLGACHALAEAHLRWLGDSGEAGWLPAAEAFGAIASRAQILVMKLARSVGRGRPADLSGDFAAMAVAWDAGTAAAEVQVRA